MSVHLLDNTYWYRYIRSAQKYIFIKKNSPEMKVSEHGLNSVKIWAHNSKKQKSYISLQKKRFFMKKNFFRPGNEFYL